MGRVGVARSEPVGRAQRDPGGGVEGLELGGWDVAERFVQAGGVEPRDPLDDRELELGAVTPDAVGDQFALEAVDEALCERVVIGVADRPDGGEDAVVGELLGVVDRRVLPLSE